MKLPPTRMCESLAELLLNGGRRYMSKQTAKTLSRLGGLVHHQRMRDKSYLVSLTELGTIQAQLFMRAWGQTGQGHPNGAAIVRRSVEEFKSLRMSNDAFVTGIRQCLESVGARPPDVVHEGTQVRIRIFGLRDIMTRLSLEPKGEWTHEMTAVWDGYIKHLSGQVGDYYTEVIKWDEN